MSEDVEKESEERPFKNSMNLTVLVVFIIVIGAYATYYSVYLPSINNPIQNNLQKINPQIIKTTIPITILFQDNYANKTISYREAITGKVVELSSINNSSETVKIESGREFLVHNNTSSFGTIDKIITIQHAVYGYQCFPSIVFKNGTKVLFTNLFPLYEIGLISINSTLELNDTYSFSISKIRSNCGSTTDYYFISTLPY